MTVRFPPGLLSYFRIVIKVFQQSRDHRNFADCTNKMYSAIADMESHVNEQIYTIEKLRNDSHGWTKLPKREWSKWLTDWREKGLNAISDAEEYLNEYPLLEREFVNQAKSGYFTTFGQSFQ